VGSPLPHLSHDNAVSLTNLRDSNTRHQVIDTFAMAIGAMMYGTNGWEEIEAYGQAQAEWFGPWHHPFRWVLTQVNPDRSTRYFLAWTEALRNISTNENLPHDCITLCRTVDDVVSDAAEPMIRVRAYTYCLVSG
jgi:hypothetical protein